MKSIFLVLFMLVPSQSFSESPDLDTEIQLPTGIVEGLHDGANKNKCFLEVTLVEEEKSEDEGLEEEGKEAKEDTTADGLYKIKVSFEYFTNPEFNREWSFLILKGSLEDSQVRELYETGRINVDGAKSPHYGKHLPADRLELILDGDGFTKSTVTSYTTTGPRFAACSFAKITKQD